MCFFELKTSKLNLTASCFLWTENDKQILQGCTVSSNGVTDGGAGGEPPTWKAKCQNWAPLAEILVFSILLIFSRLLFSCFFWGVFVFLASIDIHDIRIHYYVLTFFSVLANGPCQLRFAPPGSNLQLRHWSAVEFYSVMKHETLPRIGQQSQSCWLREVCWFNA